MRHVAVAMVMVCACVGDPDEPAASIDLGGVRQAQASIVVSDEEYRIAVRLLPVRSFDPATNAHLNREKARALALRALAIQLAGEAEVRFVATGVTVGAPSMDRKFYAVDVRVPREGVRLSRGKAFKQIVPTARVEDGIRPAASSFKLLTRRQDYVDTLNELAHLSSAEADDSGISTCDSLFFSALADIEDRGLGHLERVESEIKADPLLLTAEKDELVTAIAETRARLLASLRAAVTKREQRPAQQVDP